MVSRAVFRWQVAGSRFLYPGSITVHKSLVAFVTLSAAKGLDSSVATLPQNDRHKKL